MKKHKSKQLKQCDAAVSELRKMSKQYKSAIKNKNCRLAKEIAKQVWDVVFCSTT